MINEPHDSSERITGEAINRKGRRYIVRRLDKRQRTTENLKAGQQIIGWRLRPRIMAMRGETLHGDTLYYKWKLPFKRGSFEIQKEV